MDCVPWKNTALVVTNICLVFSGICVVAFPFCVDYVSFIVCALLLGLFVSCYISLTSIGKSYKNILYQTNYFKFKITYYVKSLRHLS